MSDERDETRRFSPFDDDVTRPAGPRPDDTVAGGGPNAVNGGTRPMPRVDDWAPSRANPAWSGRAEVRTPLPGRTDYPDTDWTAVPAREPRGRWWTPIVVGIIALVLLAVLGWASYLIVQNWNSDETPAPPATAPTAPATTAATGTAAPTTEPTTTQPTTTAPVATPSTTNPTITEITIPALSGLALPQAQAALNQMGLSYRLIFRASDAPPGTVIDSDPKEGQEVPPDTTVTLVVAAPSTSAAPTAGNGGGSTAEPGED